MHRACHAAKVVGAELHERWPDRHPPRRQRQPTTSFIPVAAVTAGPSACRADWLSDYFDRLVRKAGLPPIRLHDLRHGAATIALAAGTEMKVAQDMLGHSSISLTSDTYTSVLPELAREAAEAAARLVPRQGSKRSAGLTSGSQQPHPSTPSSGKNRKSGKKPQVKRAS